MKRYAVTKEETKQPSTLWSGRQCEKCDNKTFNVQSGGSDCCLWVKFICTKCGKIEDWDLSTGDC